MNASEIMKNEFFCVQSDENIASAAKKMAEKGFSEAPVLKEGKFVGILRLSDIAAAMLKIHMFQRPTLRNVREIQNHAVIKHVKMKGHWIRPEGDLVSILIYLKRNPNAETLPVVDPQMRIMGVIYSSDMRNQISNMISDGQEAQQAQALKRKDDKPEGQTPIDQLVNLVQSRGTISVAEASKICGITREEIQDYAKSLEKSNLIAIEYGMFGLRLIKPEKPKKGV